MDRQRQEPGSQLSPSDILDLLSTWAGNFQRNTTNAFAELRPKDYIRLIVIIGGYCLLRPYLLKLTARAQAKDHGRELGSNEANSDAAINGNQQHRRSKIDIPGVDSDSEKEQDGKGADWGRKARVRQRTMIKDKLEEHERRLREQQSTESDKEIEEFLIDD